MSKTKTKVAIVEDEAMMFEIIKMSTAMFQFETFHLKPTDDIVSFLDENNIDLLSLDFMMPGKNGLQIAREVRKDKRFKKLPIILLTSRVLDHPEFIEVGKLEINYMAKPFVPHVLIAKMTELISQSKTEE